MVETKSIKDLFDKNQIDNLYGLVETLISSWLKEELLPRPNEKSKWYEEVKNEWRTFSPPQSDKGAQSGKVYNVYSPDLNKKTIQKKKMEEALGSFHQIRNISIYYPFSCICWHTNSNCEGLRTYVHYCAGEAPSQFIYHSEGKNYAIDEKKGWNVKQFTISKEKPLWHAAWTDRFRVTFGINVKD